MKVRELMTKSPASCAPDTTLAAAAELMWMNDCGVLPVLEFGRLVGIITDRDVAIALGTRNHTAADIPVSEVAARVVQTCAPEDTVRSAMATMRSARVRRLPVVSSINEVVGMLSLNDLVRAAGHRPGQIGLNEIDADEIVHMMQSICEHRSAKHAEVTRTAA